MKRRLITAFFLLTVMWSYCQETYPQKIVIEDDTIVCINRKQVVLINETFDELNFYKGKNDSLHVDLLIHKELIEKQLNINTILANKNTELINEVYVLDLKNEVNKEIIDLYSKGLTQQKNKGMKLMIGGFTVGVSVGVITVLLLTR